MSGENVGNIHQGGTDILKQNIDILKTEWKSRGGFICLFMGG